MVSYYYPYSGVVPAIGDTYAHPGRLDHRFVPIEIRNSRRQRRTPHGKSISRASARR
jgi:hypothetical protein